MTNWSNKFGVSASKTGRNLLVGPGIPDHPDDLKNDASVMTQTTHSNEMGRQLAFECQRHLLGAEDDDEIPEIISKAMADGAEPFGALRTVVCDSPHGACGKAKAKPAALGAPKKADAKKADGKKGAKKSKRKRA